MLSIIVLALLYAVAARAFLFEIKFQKLRDYLSAQHKLFDIFLSCPFCNGFWCGLVTYALVVSYEFTSVEDVIHLVYFCLLAGFVSWLQRMYTSQWDYS